VRVANGFLELTARTESSNVTCKAGSTTLSKPRSTGEVSTWRRLEQTYGRVEILAQLPTMTVNGQTAKGLQESFWMWPKNTGKYSESNEEIDIAEMYGQYPTLVIPYIHYNHSAQSGNPVTNTAFPVNGLDTQLHRYVLEWTPQHLTMSIDGAVIVHHTIQSNLLFGRTAPEPFDHDFFLILSQGLGIGANGYQDGTGTHVPKTPLPATTKIDHVYVWGPPS
jgi:beta-glucanase (GH16 family)